MWERALDDMGREYYWNTVSDETSWTPPLVHFRIVTTASGRVRTRLCARNSRVEVMRQQISKVVEESDTLRQMIMFLRLESAFHHSACFALRNTFAVWKEVSSKSYRTALLESFRSWERHYISMRWARRCQKLRETVGTVLSVNAALKVDNASLAFDVMAMHGARRLRHASSAEEALLRV